MNSFDGIGRYDRQARFEEIGTAGQGKLASGRALICGCGALGSTISSILARAGIGFLRIVDRDFVEVTNLQRQMLFDESDAKSGIPKAIAASEKLARVNSEIFIEPVVADLTSSNISSLAGDVDVILDGTDNFATRFLINDFAVKHGKPWIYGGCVGAEGHSMTILPGETACLACLMSDAPAPGALPTCDTAGILAAAASVIGSIQANEAIKLLSENRAAVNRNLLMLDLWRCQFRTLDLSRLLETADCRTCRQRRFDWLDGSRSEATAVLCGRNAVQINASASASISFDEIARRLAGIGEVVRNPYLLRVSVDEYILTLFQDGRMIISGTDDVSVARSLHAKYIGA